MKVIIEDDAKRDSINQSLKKKSHEGLRRQIENQRELDAQIGSIGLANKIQTVKQMQEKEAEQIANEKKMKKVKGPKKIPGMTDKIKYDLELIEQKKLSDKVIEDMRVREVNKTMLKQLDEMTFEENDDRELTSHEIARIKEVYQQSLNPESGFLQKYEVNEQGEKLMMLEEMLNKEIPRKIQWSQVVQDGDKNGTIKHIGLDFIRKCNLIKSSQFHLDNAFIASKISGINWGHIQFEQGITIIFNKDIFLQLKNEDQKSLLAGLINSIFNENLFDRDDLKARMARESSIMMTTLFEIRELAKKMIKNGKLYKFEDDSIIDCLKDQIGRSLTNALLSIKPAYLDEILRNMLQDLVASGRKKLRLPLKTLRQADTEYINVTLPGDFLSNNGNLTDYANRVIANIGISFLIGIKQLGFSEDNPMHTFIIDDSGSFYTPLTGRNDITIFEGLHQKLMTSIYDNRKKLKRSIGKKRTPAKKTPVKEGKRSKMVGEEESAEDKPETLSQDQQAWKEYEEMSIDPEEEAKVRRKLTLQQNPKKKRERKPYRQ